MSMPFPKVLITAGPTREYLDPVRFLSNASSGVMGYELARHAKKLGLGGKALVQREYSLENMVKKNAELYKCLIRDKRAKGK